MKHHCPACGSEQMDIFYSLEKIPVHSVRLLWSQHEAVTFPSGKMDLAHCSNCGFICNLSYDPDLQDYSAEYESTQAYSATFNSFARRLAQQIIDKYDLHHKDIIEIGCGQGEFLTLLCELGDNRGVGFDPAFDPERSAVSETARVTIVPDYYSEKYAAYKADFYCCKMTLEHIRDVASFIGIVRRVIGSHQLDTTVFFQVPDVNRVLDEVAFWDIYYEHCSYFSLGSMARLFRAQNFEVKDLWRDYGNQYLMIEARPASHPTKPSLSQENDLEELDRKVKDFASKAPIEIQRWKKVIQDARSKGEKVVLWGSGSKGVAFLTTIEDCEDIQYTVDINPKKHGTFMAGTGQKVVSPDFLHEYRPDLVILMNRVYQQEVQEELSRQGISPRILNVGQ